MKIKQAEICRSCSQVTERCEKMFLDDGYTPRCNEGDTLFDRVFDDSRSDVVERDCGCERDGCGNGEYDTTWGLRDRPVAMVYSVLQDFDCLYDKEEALSRGTLFEALDLPFVGSWGGSCGVGNSCGMCGGSRYDR